MKANVLSCLILGLLGWTTFFSAGYGVFKFGVLLALGLYLALQGVGVGRWWWFCGVLVFSWLFGVSHIEGFMGLYGEHEGGVLGWLICILVSNSGIPGKDIRKALCWCGFFVVLVAWCQHFGLSLPYGDRGRLYSTLGSPVYSGNLLGMVLPLTTGWLQPAFLLSGIWIMSSRGGLLGALVGMAVLKIKNWRVLVLLGGLVVLGAAVFPNKPISDKGRLYVWLAACEGFMEKSVTGWGPDSFSTIAIRYRRPQWSEFYPNSTQGNAHNLILEILCTLGLPGLIAFCYCFKLPKDKIPRSAVLSALTSGMFNPLSLEVKTSMFALMGEKVKSSIWERRVLVGVFSVGCLLWGQLAAHDRLASMGPDKVWGLWKQESQFRIRFLMPIDETNFPLYTGGAY